MSENAVMISVRPNWVQKILSGEKTLEIRKTRPKIEPPFKCFIYCTSAKTLNLHDYVKIHAETGGAVDEWSGKVVAEFICDEFKVIPFDRNHNSDLTRIQTEGSCLTAVQVMDYLKQGSMYGFIGFGWHISDLKIYDQPKPLSDFKRWQGTGAWSTLERLERAPQSWCYVDGGLIG